MIPLVDLPRLHAPLRDDLIAAFVRVLDSGQFILGQPVEAFEDALARYTQAAFSVGTSSGTDALLMALMALQVRPGDEIITTPFTFFATACTIVRLGATPVFADIDPDTLLIDPDAVAAAITPRTVGIIPVHLFGCCADMTRIQRIADAAKLWVIEDAAQALGATHQGRMAGTMGTLGACSFFPAKLLGALGDAGAVFGNDASLQPALQALRTHGTSTKYYHKCIGGNFRMDALQAELLRIKLDALPREIEARQAVVTRYRDAFARAEGIALAEAPAGDTWLHHPFVLQLDRRDAVRDALTQHRIATAIYYPSPLHLSPALSHLGHRDGAFPNAETASRRTLAIPSYAGLEGADQARIIDLVTRAAAGASPGTPTGTSTGGTHP